ncbi:PRC-barrel domain-containing protein [Reyranella sp. CPCC 100927]|uniref:PRC-barrel domain-containing protein n=1 Tax=Reyranella sp. CPCC 100927 TaxID=2599616 RepID=UPI0011B5FE70|nr:PRC-barrel domain-containing protein [Reyranella sp. CPCC 100927]TWT15892.1 PRC-barrel domain containing protein [Reyranella sp. CPCC 100927]
MQRLSLSVGAAAVALSVLAAGPGFTQGQPQTITKVDVQQVSTGFRASKVIGADVVNAANESIGKIDDVIIASDGKAPYAVLSIGGFLGMGARLIAVPYESLRVVEKKIMLPGATKEQLKTLPEFRYASN